MKNTLQNSKNNAVFRNSLKPKHLFVAISLLVLFIVILFALTGYYFGLINTKDNQALTNTQDVSAAVSGDSTVPSCYSWSFDSRPHGQIITSLTSSQVGSLNAANIGVSYRNNIKPTGDYDNPYKVFNAMVVDPYVNTNTPDLRVGLGKMLILNGGKHYLVSDVNNENPVYTEGGTYNRDNHHGGDFILNFNGGNITQVKFTSVDIGDEFDGKGRINNNYYTVTTADNAYERVNMSFSGQENSNLPDKYVWEHSTKDYGKNIKSMTIHYSGSGGLDNLTYCNKPVITPTSTLTPTPTIRPASPTPSVAVIPTSTMTPTPTSSAKACKEEVTKTFHSGEFISYTPSKRSFNLGEVQFNDLAKKYDIKVKAYWGWTGDTTQIGPGNNLKVQSNERHKVSINLRDNQSSATKTEDIFCDDLGNTLLYNDGSSPLTNIIAPASNTVEQSKFIKCRKNISIEANNGTEDFQRTLNLEGKYDKILLTSLLDYTDANYQTCLQGPGGSKKKCAQSHYSKVEVTYCTKEG